MCLMSLNQIPFWQLQVGGQAVLGRQSAYATPWLTERHGFDPTFRDRVIFSSKPNQDNDKNN